LKNNKQEQNVDKTSGSLAQTELPRFLCYVTGRLAGAACGQPGRGSELHPAWGCVLNSGVSPGPSSPRSTAGGVQGIPYAPFRAGWKPDSLSRQFIARFWRTLLL